MKKLVPILLGCFLLSISLFALTACNGGNENSNNPPHTHDYKTLKFDSISHWYECECGEKSGVAFHNLINNACICGYQVTETHTHDYKTLKFDSISHWYECECGDKSNLENHKGGTATETSKPICSVCNSEYGSTLIHTHNFNKEVVNENYLKTPAKCESKAEYYYSCSCGEKGTNIFLYGDELGHNYDAWISDGNGMHSRTCKNNIAHVEVEKCSGGFATETTKPICSTCNGEYGSVAEHEHSFELRQEQEKYLKSRATCTEKAKYYYSCRCGEKDDLYYEFGSELGHDYSDWMTNKNNTHSRICKNDKEHIETEKCFGGVATEIEKAICNACGGEYGELMQITSGLNFNLNKDSTYSVISYSGTSKDVYIPTTYMGLPVSSIGDGAFSRKSIKSITISNSINKVGSEAFEDCDLLENIIIPDSVISLGGYVFSGCDSLKTVTIGKGVISIPEYAFEDCKSLCFVGMSNNVIDIGGAAFRGCRSLQSIELPNSVNNIGEGAFYDCKSLKNINLPENLMIVGSSAFSECESLQYSVKDGLKYLGDEKNKYFCLVGVDNISTDNVIIDVDCKVIGGSAFRGLSILKNITIPQNIKGIGSYAFAQCSGLQALLIPGNVVKIGDWVFSNCKSLKTVNIEEGVTSIGKEAFAYCESLQNIVIPSSIVSIGDNVFMGCLSLEYNSCDGIKYLGNNNNPYIYLVGVLEKTSVTYTIASNCKFVGSGAFKECKKMTQIVIPNSVIYIGGSAFSSCESLQLVVIGRNIVSIGAYAFSSCKMLRSIWLPITVSNITRTTFYGCKLLESIACEAEKQPGSWDLYWFSTGYTYNIEVKWGITVK